MSKKELPKDTIGLNLQIRWRLLIATIPSLLFGAILFLIFGRDVAEAGGLIMFIILFYFKVVKYYGEILTKNK